MEATSQVTMQNDCALEMNFRRSAMWSKRASELEDISRISEPNWHSPLSGC
jgi:hypothetical protein